MNIHVRHDRRCRSVVFRFWRFGDKCCWNYRLSVRYGKESKYRIVVCPSYEGEAKDPYHVLKLLDQAADCEMPQQARDIVDLYRELLRHRAAGATARKRKGRHDG